MLVCALPTHSLILCVCESIYIYNNLLFAALAENAISHLTFLSMAIQIYRKFSSHVYIRFYYFISLFLFRFPSSFFVFHLLSF